MDTQNSVKHLSMGRKTDIGNETKHVRGIFYRNSTVCNHSPEVAHRGSTQSQIFTSRFTSILDIMKSVIPGTEQTYPIYVDTWEHRCTLTGCHNLHCKRKV